MGVAYMIGSLIGYLVWGFLGVVGGYLSYNKKDTENSFSDYYFLKPFIAAIGIMFFLGNILGRALGLLGIIISLVIINLVTYYMVKKRS